MRKLLSAWRPARLLLVGPLLLLGCKLTTTDVEPALPAVPVNDSATLVYRANGLPVVANNSVNIGTIFLAFLGDSRAVKAKWPGQGSSLSLVGSDVHNQPGGYLTHSLNMELVAFHGAGTYPLLPTMAAYPGTYYQLTTYNPTGNPLDHAEQYPVATAPAQVVITDWNPGTRQLTGTFTLDVAGRNNPQAPTHITEGGFVVVVD